MPAIDAFIELARQVRLGTQELLAAVPEGALLWAPKGLQNHILWHAGHCLWLQDALAVVPIKGQSELPESWASRFGQHTRPLLTKTWPGRNEIHRRLTEQLDRLIALYRGLSEAQLGDGRRHPRTGWPLLPGLLHAWHDEASHQGEMYLLYKQHRTLRRG
jgi:hypothetical protein